MTTALLRGLVLLAPTLALRLPPRPPHFGDPLGLHARPPLHGAAAAAAATSLPALLLGAIPASAADVSQLSQVAYDAALDPKTFQPVCPASDGFYNFGKTLVTATVGPEAYKEYAPLIAGGLLRVRLELCVVESFVYEAIVPFIKENGLSWVLPVHETVETFLAGTVFAIASNFILIGSTKIVTVIFTYGDVFLGFPFRVVGGLGWKGLEANVPEKEPPVPVEEEPQDFLAKLFPEEKPKYQPPSLQKVVRANTGAPAATAQLVFWGALRGVGEVSKSVREGIELLDIFVGRYLLLTTVAYVGIKFVHFKLWDPFPM